LDTNDYPNCRVYHYHLEDKEVSHKRTITVHILRHRLLHAQPQPTASMTGFFLSYAKTLFSNRELTIKEKLHWLRFSVANRLATQSRNVLTMIFAAI